MLEFLQQYWGTLLAGVVVLAAVTFAALSVYRAKKSGYCVGCSKVNTEGKDSKGCTGHCDGCHGCDNTKK